MASKNDSGNGNGNIETGELFNNFNNFNKSCDNLMRSGCRRYEYDDESNCRQRYNRCSCYMEFSERMRGLNAECGECDRDRCDNKDNDCGHTPVICASLYSDTCQTVEDNCDIAYNKCDAVLEDMLLSPCGTALTVHKTGYYNIIFGVDAHGIIGCPEVNVYVNSCAAKGCKLRIASTNHLNSLAKIVFLKCGDIIHVKDTCGSLMLQNGYVNAYLDVTFVGDKHKDRDC